MLDSIKNVCKTMRLIILTTGSVRRRYFAQALHDAVPVTRVFVETGELTPPFETTHPFEAKSKEYEKNAWFKGHPPTFTDIAATEYFPSLNQTDAVRAMTAIQPDIMIVFGTRKLSTAVIDACPAGVFNVHTGDPEQYRGLDAHLWTIYHRDFAALSVAVQSMSTDLDRGDILAMKKVAIEPGMRLFQLRAASTQAAVELSRQAVNNFQSPGGLETRPLRTVGRYYSFMPSVLKELCVKRFERFTSQL